MSSSEAAPKAKGRKFGTTAGDSLSSTDLRTSQRLGDMLGVKMWDKRRARLAPIVTTARL